MAGTLTYRFYRLFWSIYFVLSIAIVGLIFGYFLSLLIFSVAFLLSPWPVSSERFRHFGENFQCLAIRGLLKIQPWLSCETNLPSILGFYEKFKSRKIIFVANHRSNLDTFLLISYIPGLRGLAKSSLFQNIFFAPYMLLIGFIPITRGSLESISDGLRQMKDKLLMRNRPVLIFPETTRCEKNFLSVQKFGTFFFTMAIESDALIIPIAILRTDQVMGRGDFLIHPNQKTKIKMLEPIRAEDFRSSNDLCDFVHQQIKVAHNEL